MDGESMGFGVFLAFIACIVLFGTYSFGSANRAVDIHNQINKYGCAEYMKD